MVDALTVERFLRAGGYGEAGDRDAWQRTAFLAWRIELMIGSVVGVDASKVPSFAAYLKQMGIGDGS